MKKLTVLLLFLIVFLGVILRLYRFDGPIADWHSWRQADTSAVSRNLANDFDLFHPKFDDLSNVPSGLNNPEGYRFVEFPLYNGAQAGLFRAIGVITIEQWGRIISIFASSIAAIFVFLILRKHQNDTAGLIGAFFFAVLPYSVYYGRTILPDMSMAAAILGGVYFFDVWIDEYLKKGSKYHKYQLLFFITSLALTTMALLLKPFALFFTLPMIYLAFSKLGRKAFWNPYLWTYALIALLPLAFWRIWLTQFPEGVPANKWLLNEGNIRFKPSYFNWVFAERISKLILGYWGVSLFVLGLISKIRKDSWFLYSFIFASLFYLVIFARGNVQHDYYQILILPTIAIYLGLGGDFLLSFVKSYTNKYIGPVLFLVITFFTLLFGAYIVRDYFNINNRSIIVAGEAVDRLTPKDSKVIAIYNGDTSFLYQTNRQGWASFQNDLPVMIELGADYLILINPAGPDFNFVKDYEVLDQQDEYIIYDLKKSL